MMADMMLSILILVIVTPVAWKAIGWD